MATDVRRLRAHADVVAAYAQHTADHHQRILITGVTMKPSHTQTPRTLAECSFETGYPTARPEPYGRLATVAYGLLLVACLAFIGVMLAWRI